MMNDRPSVPALESASAAVPTPSLPTLLSQQRACWQRGERLPAETFRVRHPCLANAISTSLGLAGTIGEMES